MLEAELFQLLSPATMWNALRDNVVSASSIDLFWHQLNTCVVQQFGPSVVSTLVNLTSYPNHNPNNYCNPNPYLNLIEEAVLIEPCELNSV